MEELEAGEQRTLITPDELFDVTLEEEDYEVRPGRWMRIRALTRAQMIRAGKLEEDRAKQEQYLLSVALVQPVLTVDEVARWQRSAAFMEVEKVARAINRISGVGKDAAKSDVHGDGDES